MQAEVAAVLLLEPLVLEVLVVAALGKQVLTHQLQERLTRAVVVVAVLLTITAVVATAAPASSS
jgi:hypothetical protein